MTGEHTGVDWQSKDLTPSVSLQGVTVDLYGHLIPGGNKQAVDRLDQPVEKEVIAGYT